MRKGGRARRTPPFPSKTPFPPATASPASWATALRTPSRVAWQSLRFLNGPAVSPSFRILARLVLRSRAPSPSTSITSECCDLAFSLFTLSRRVAQSPYTRSLSGQYRAGWRCVRELSYGYGGVRTVQPTLLRPRSIPFTPDRISYSCAPRTSQEQEEREGKMRKGLGNR